MVIHTVARGENVLSIAKKYGISPAKIIECNCMPYPDKLLPGQKILIFVPTRTYVVRGGDTVAKVCKRFEIRKNTLLANNPGLHGMPILRAGTELSIRYDAPKYSFAALNGYIYNGTSAQRFHTMLPYMTYLTFCYESFETQPFLQEANKQNKIPLFRLPLEAIFDSKGEVCEDFEQTIIKIKSKGYRGITLSCAKKDFKKRDDKTILDIKKHLLGKDMLLFCELEAEGNEQRFDAADGIVVLYEKCHKKEIPTFEEGEKSAVKNFANRYEAGKAFLEISSFGYDEKNILSMEQIHKIATKYQAEYGYDDLKMISYLDYTAFNGGNREALRIHFEAPENIKAKLDLIHEFGFIGAAVDIGRIPISTVLMLYTTFCGIECPYTGIFGA